MNFVACLLFSFIYICVIIACSAIVTYLEDKYPVLGFIVHVSFLVLTLSVIIYFKLGR